MKSCFTEKEITPSQKDLKKALGSTFSSWLEIQEYAKKSYPCAVEEWNFSSPKYGWSFRVKDKKRVIIYLLPREQFFKVAMVFGQKATNEILKSSISDIIKQDIQNARVYAEGRGIRIDITDKALTADIKTLISIKLSH